MRRLAKFARPFLPLLIACVVAYGAPPAPDPSGRSPTRIGLGVETQAVSGPTIMGADSSLVLRLDAQIYRFGDEVKARLEVDEGRLRAKQVQVILVATQTEDVEELILEAELLGFAYQVTEGVSLQPGVTGKTKAGDGVLSVQAGELVYAMVYPDYEREPDLVGRAQVVYDLALVEPADDPALAPLIEPKLAMTRDETKPPPGGKALGSLVDLGGQPVQLPVEELIFTPRRPTELARFLDEVGGEVIDEMGGADQEPIYLVRVDPRVAAGTPLVPMLEFMGFEGRLVASNERVLDLLRLVLRLRFEGYNVAVNPRLHPHTVPAFDDDEPTHDAFTLEGFDVDRAWAFAEVFDHAELRVQAAFVDQGFSPNPDFRGFGEGSIHQCRRDGAQFECGPDFAVGLPGEGLFGASSWHGNGMVTVAGGVQNNAYGTSGVAGPVMEPMLYNMLGGVYFFDVASGLAQAVADGASVINFSSGFPCNLLTDIGAAPGICGPGEATRFCTEVVLGLMGAIELACVVCPFPITCGILCTIARTAYISAFGACISLLPTGDWRGPLAVEIDRAYAAGVPVVASSGNRIRSLPDLLEGIIDTSDMDAGHWQVIPCVLDHVICVGAANIDPGYTNQEFHGDVVDIWAPTERMAYFAPPTLEALESPADQIRHRSSGTSPAAAYITGTIVLLQAMQPDLDRNRTGRTGAALRAITDDLLDVMQATAHSPVDVRGLLVNPFAAVEVVTQAAIGQTLDDFSYDRELNFEDHDLTVDLSLPADTTDTVHFYSGPGGTSIDADTYLARMPAAEGLYRMDLELRVPQGFGTLVVSGLDPIDPVWTTVSDGREQRRRYQLGTFFNTTELDFEVRHASGGGGPALDNVYRFSAGAEWVAPLPDPDRFDTDDAAVNPPESRPRNDAKARAVQLGRIHEPAFPELGWPDCTDCRERIQLVDLNFDRADDEDWFEVRPPECLRLAGLRECNLRVDIESEGLIDVLAVDAFDRLIGYGRNGVQFWLDKVGAGPLYLQLVNGSGERYVEYYLIMEHREWTRPYFPDAHVMKGPLWFGYPRLVPPRDCPECLGWLELNLDWLGRATDPDDYHIYWAGGETFRAFIELVDAQSVSLAVIDLAGNELARASTPDLDKAASFVYAGTTSGLLIELPGLPQGQYLLQVSHAKPGSRFYMTLGAGAVHDGGLPLEDYLGFPSEELPKQ